MSILKAERLRKVFVSGFFRRRTVAVDEVSFAVERGEVFGYLGPNGAGKTTTMKMLTGLILPTSGSATLFDKPVGDRESKLRLGYLPENPYFYDHLTAPEFLHLVGHLFGLPRNTRNRRAGELLERLDLQHAARRPLRSFSKGMMQRVGLAQALIGDPDLVVLDEPMSGLDPIGRKLVRDLIMELRDRGKTVFFSTHILSDAALLCDRVGIIVDGRMRDVGPLGALLSPKVLQIEVLWEMPNDAPMSDWRERFPGDHSTTSEGEVYRSSTQTDADQFVAALLAQGGHALSVTPQRESLEDLFVRDVAELGCPIAISEAPA
ncbi:MAG: ABC transporter ATP-binding protein [Nannocystaceae bacterium]